MTASSVTGTGSGSADHVNKNAEHTTLGINHLIGPRVVDCGSVALGSASPSTIAVTFAKALASATGFYVVATAVGSTAATASQGICVSAVATTGFTFTGANTVTTTINWALLGSPLPTMP